MSKISSKVDDERERGLTRLEPQLTEHDTVEEEFMAALQIALQYCHMNSGSNDEQKEEDRSDWYIDTLGRPSTKCPRLRHEGTPAHLKVVILQCQIILRIGATYLGSLTVAFGR